MRVNKNLSGKNSQKEKHGKAPDWCLLRIEDQAVGKVSLAWPYTSEIYGLEGTVIEIHVTQNHLRESEIYEKSVCLVKILQVFVARRLHILWTTHLQFRNLESLYWRFSSEPVNVLSLNSLPSNCSVWASYSLARMSFRYSGHQTIRP